MTNDFRSCNVIYIVYDRKNENHWSLLVTHYSLLGIQTQFCTTFLNRFYYFVTPVVY